MVTLSKVEGLPKQCYFAPVVCEKLIKEETNQAAQVEFKKTSCLPASNLAPEVSSAPTSGPAKKPYDPYTMSIFALFAAYTLTQMDLNSKTEMGFADQQTAQTNAINSAIAKEALAVDPAPPVKAKLSWWKCLLIAVAGVVLAPVTMGASLAAAGGVILGAQYGKDQPLTNALNTNPVELPQELTAQQQTQATNDCAQRCQMANNAISTGEQQNVVGASERNSALGSQASQIFGIEQACMATPQGR